MKKKILTALSIPLMLLASCSNEGSWESVSWIRIYIYGGPSYYGSSESVSLEIHEIGRYDYDILRITEQTEVSYITLRYVSFEFAPEK